MTDRRPPYHRRQTKPIPRAELAPTASSRDAETLVPCPACDGHGMVTVEKRAELQAKLAKEEP